MKSPKPVSWSLAFFACASVAVVAAQAEDKKKDPPAKAPAAVASKPAAVATKPLVQKPVQTHAATQLKSLHSDTQSRGAYAAGGTTFDGRKAAAPAVKANPSSNQKTAAQISKEQSAIPRAQPYKLKKSPEPPPPGKQ